MTWYVYLLECRDGSIYTGIALDVEARFALHASGRGARYTRSRKPRRVLAVFGYPDRSAASKAEHAIKRLAPGEKRALCDGRFSDTVAGAIRIDALPTRA